MERRERKSEEKESWSICLTVEEGEHSCTLCGHWARFALEVLPWRKLAGTALMNVNIKKATYLFASHSALHVELWDSKQPDALFSLCMHYWVQLSIYFVLILGPYLRSACPHPRQPFVAERWLNAVTTRQCQVSEIGYTKEQHFSLSGRSMSKQD